MRLTSVFCRQQADDQRLLALNTTLENARAVALKAALAWDREARDAERRETRADRLSDDDADIAAEFRQEDEEEALRSAAGITTPSSIE